MFNRDDDYVVIDGQVKIVDEQTGRIMEGRRWSDGLHQAVEAKEHGVKLVGLSALMTTTLGAMEETIQLVKQSCPDCKIVVGGAVLTADYAEKIGADFYAKDAMETVAVAKEVVG